jgi:hypothetical protein
LKLDKILIVLTSKTFNVSMLLRLYVLMLNMWLEKKFNKRLISFIIWWSIFKLAKKWGLELKEKAWSVGKIKDFFDSWIKEMKKDINKMNDNINNQ